MRLLSSTYRVLSVRKVSYDYEVVLEWTPGRLTALFGATSQVITYRGNHFWRIYPSGKEADIFFMNTLQTIVAGYEMQNE